METKNVESSITAVDIQLKPLEESLSEELVSELVQTCNTYVVLPKYHVCTYILLVVLYWWDHAWLECHFLLPLLPIL